MQTQSPDQPAEEGRTCGTVLVVDDNPDLVDLVQLALSAHGYQTVGADDASALACAVHHRPDVILLDLMMPHIDGWEVGRRLRADPATANIPIVAMSAYRLLWKAAPLPHMDDRLPKPFDLDDLYAVVARWMGRRHTAGTPETETGTGAGSRGPSDRRQPRVDRRKAAWDLRALALAEQQRSPTQELAALSASGASLAQERAQLEEQLVQIEAARQALVDRRAPAPFGRRQSDRPPGAHLTA